MRRSFLISMRCTMALAVIVAVGIYGATPGYAAGSTARTALESAIEAAKQWRPDAILSSVYTAGADIDGKSTSWSYGFYSPKAGSYLNVAARGRSITTLEIAVGQNVAVPADFLDSDLAVAAATKAGIKAESMRMRLTKTEWLVNSGDQKGALTIWLNPRTGRLIKSQKVQ
jgi:hypothetical protein